MFLFGDILGALRHLCFTETTLPVIANRAIFSALKVVPLRPIGFEALEF